MKDATIEASAQQTRFDPAAVGATAKRELDLKDVTVTIRETGRDLLSHATIKLNASVRYLLHGQNGTGKSTILKALGKRLIPGIADGLRISYLEQREAEAKDKAQDTTSVIDLVIASDTVRKEALRRRLCKCKTTHLRSLVDFGGRSAAGVRRQSRLSGSDKGC